MERKWYYAVDGVRHGPLTEEELRALLESGTLGDAALVWQPEFGPSWRAASEVRPLLARAPSAPPPPAAPAEDVPLAGAPGACPSALEAASQAFARTCALLFRPFDIVRWLSMGFCAWLAYLSLPAGNYSQRVTSSEQAPKVIIDQALDGLVRALHGATAGAWLFAVVFWVLLGVWLCSLRSRGDFMFLHRWYQPDAPILPSWRAARAPGQSLFLWRLAFYGVVLLLLALDGAYVYQSVLGPYLQSGKVWQASLLKPLVLAATAAFLLSFAAQVVEHLAKAFVVPVMYWRGVSAARAWRSVFDLCNQHPFAVLSYLCVGALCSILAAFAVLAIGVCTCCIGLLPLLVPYVNGVAMLPVTLFFRGYAACFLSQWRPDLVPASA
jgi:hypothetical protein